MTDNTLDAYPPDWECDGDQELYPDPSVTGVSRDRFRSITKAADEVLDEWRYVSREVRSYRELRNMHAALSRLAKAMLTP